MTRAPISVPGERSFVTVPGVSGDKIVYSSHKLAQSTSLRGIRFDICYYVEDVTSGTAFSSLL